MALGRPVTNVVEVRLRIAADFSNAAKDIDAFRENFRSGVAEVAGISKERVMVRGITKGSIIVDFMVTAAETMSDTSAAAAIQEVERKVSEPNAWPNSLSTLMAAGATVEAKAVREIQKDEIQAMAIMSSGAVFLTPLAGYAPPLGCSCRRGDGVTAGCANHKSLSPPWCLVDSACPQSQQGVQGTWAWCETTDGNTRDDRPTVVDSGRGCHSCGVTGLVAMTIFLLTLGFTR